jgi:hypothetical protein
MVEAHEAVGGSSKRGRADPDVVLPPAVKKAAERADELSRQANEHRIKREADEANTPELPIAAPPTPSPSPTFQVAKFDPSNPNPPSELTMPPEKTTPPPSPSPSPSPSPPTENSDWEHQFQSLKGRYERETETNRRMARQIADMQHLMASLQTAPPAPTPSTPQSGSGVRFDSGVGQPRYVTPEEVKEYGEELMDIVGRRAREVYEPIISQLTNELNTVRQQVGGVRSSVAYDASVKMYEDLAKEVPHWESINSSPEFGRWLDQPDPLTGQIRRNILAWSHRNNLTGSVIAAFKGFLSDQASFGPANGGTVPGNGADGYSQSNPVASTPQTDLRQFAAPGRAKTGQTQVPPEKPFFSTAEITQFYRDKTAGKYAGREAEADALERALYEAGREGRIRR